MFDPVDVIFDLPGVVAGYSVSPDSRYAVVNLRPWSANPDLSGKYNCNVEIRHFVDQIVCGPNPLIP